MTPGSDYAVFVWSAYGVTALAIVALIANAVIDARAQRRALARLEASDRGGGATGG